MSFVVLFLIVLVIKFIGGFLIKKNVFKFLVCIFLIDCGRFKNLILVGGVDNFVVFKSNEVMVWLFELD